MLWISSNSSQFYGEDNDTPTIQNYSISNNNNMNLSTMEKMRQKRGRKEEYIADNMSWKARSSAVKFQVARSNSSSSLYCKLTAMILNSSIICTS